MAFIVQTNPPTDEANAYISVAFFRAYHADRGRDYSNVTTFPDSLVQSWIVLATQFLDVRFKFYGIRVSSTQTTEFPRSSLYNVRGDQVQGIPLCVQQATAEYAHRARTSALLGDPEQDASGMVLKSKSETVGPISERVEYASHLGLQMPSYPLADRLILAQGLAPRESVGGLSSGSLERS